MQPTLAQLRERAPLKWDIGKNIRGAMYHNTDGVRIDLTKFGDKKTVCISLRDYQFVTLYHIREMVSTWVRKLQTKSYELGDSVKITHSQFRGVWSVAIRQHYQDDKGDEKPSMWGVNFTHEAWRHFTGSVIKEICKYSDK